MIRLFAAGDPFRSARADELERPDIGFRRPLRPEDLSFLDFALPVGPATICHLPSLASHRFLRCLYEAPNGGEEKEEPGAASDGAGSSRAATEQLIGFFESFALGSLDRLSGGGFLDLTTVADDVDGFAKRLEARIPSERSLRNGLRLILVQQRCIRTAALDAIARAMNADGTVFPPADMWPRLGQDEDDLAFDAVVEAALGLDPGADVYWQFYLPTSLALANQTTRLASRPTGVLELIGAAFVIEAARLPFTAWIRRQAWSSGAVGGSEPGRPATQAVRDLSASCRKVQAAVEERFGASGLAEFARGGRTTARLIRLAGCDLERQLAWLTSLGRHSEMARQIEARIQRERPDIDRDTFEEPREMCSTTHVHDEHRLVAIESGEMVFWGWPGMRYTMTAGDMLLVPRGRLHGSTVTSELCLYHQPIIPDDWVAQFMRETQGSPAE